MRLVVVIAFGIVLSNISNAQTQLIGHWPLQGSVDASPQTELTAQATAVTFGADGPTKTLSQAATFDGESSVLDIAASKLLDLKDQPFSLAAWINAPESSGDVPGDLISQYDPKTLTGFHLGLYSHGGVTNSQSNFRQLHFGIDQGQIEKQFTDHGHLGTAVYVFSLCVHDGKLYASTCHAGADEAGRVWRFEGTDRWTDLGSPDRANAISALTVFEGALYAGSSKYRLAGSSLAESTNSNFGGKVFRLGADDQWVPCGTLSPETEGISSLIEFKGRLYAGALYKPAGFFRYEGGEKWTASETPNGKRVEAMTVFNGSLYASCYDEGSVFRFDGTVWHEAGKIPNATQTYGFAVHNGSLFVSEWPLAHVYRYLGGSDWDDVGRLGEELETMPLLVYNGKMYGGTLPLAEVYRYDGSTTWSKIGRVDMTPDVRFRRAWSMAVFQGRLFVGALPSGRVLSIEVGRNVTYDKPMPAGWHHVAAVRDTHRLRLYVDGKQISESAPLEEGQYNLSGSSELKIGFGAQDFFKGRLADVRIYQGALSQEDVQTLSNAAK